MQDVTSLTIADLASEALRAKITVMGNQFIKESGYPAPFNEAHCFEQWKNLIRFEVGEFMVINNDEGLPKAVLGAMFVKDLFTGYLSGSEIFWFVEPESRNAGKLGIQLFNAFERRCDQLGVRIRVMAHIEGLRGDALARLYRRRGYAKVEQFFRKEVV